MSQTIVNAPSPLEQVPANEVGGAKVQKGRLEFLDVIRGIAALSVAVHHYLSVSSNTYNYWALKYFNLGGFGVVSFFLVSGFIIPYTLERGGTLQRFWISRFFRLFPLYWVSLFGIVLFDHFHKMYLPTGAHVHLAKFVLSNALMLQLPAHEPSAFPLYYTLLLEMSFYALCSIFFWIGRNRKSQLLAWIAMAVMLVTNVGAAIVFHKSLSAGACGMLVSSFVGTVLYRVFSNEETKAGFLRLLPPLAIVFAICFYYRFSMYPALNEDPRWNYSATLITWPLAYLFVLTMYKLRNLKYPAVLRWLGQISYSVYLTHLFVFYLIPWPLDNPFAIFGYLALSVGVSWVTYSLIEKPAIDLGHRIAKRYAPAPKKAGV